MRACLFAIEGAATLDAHASSLAHSGVCPESTALAALAEAVRTGLLVRAHDRAPDGPPTAIP